MRDAPAARSSAAGPGGVGGGEGEDDDDGDDGAGGGRRGEDGDDDLLGDESGVGGGSRSAPPEPLLTLGGRLQLVDQQQQQQTTSPDAVVRSHLAVCPPDHEYQHLCAIYLENIHPILPILREADLLATRTPDSNKMKPLSARHRLLKQVVSLASGVDPSCARHLRLLEEGEGGDSSSSSSSSPAVLLPTQAFHQRLARAIFASLDAAGSAAVADTVDRIRILLLMSLFYQPRNASGRDMSPLLFSQAVHHAQSIGIHLRKGGDDSDFDAEGLFCAMAALDRMNAAFHGRPCLLHQRDTDREMVECIAKQRQPAFRLFLGVCQMLDRVICLYRPRNDGVESVELPVYESMIIDAGAEKLPSRLLCMLCSCLSFLFFPFSFLRLSDHTLSDLIYIPILQPLSRSSTTPSRSSPAASPPAQPQQPPRRQHLLPWAVAAEEEEEAISLTRPSTPAALSRQTASSTTSCRRCRRLRPRTASSSCPSCRTPSPCRCRSSTSRCATPRSPCTASAPSSASARSSACCRAWASCTRARA